MRHGRRRSWPTSLGTADDRHTTGSAFDSDRAGVPGLVEHVDDRAATVGVDGQ